MMRVILTLLGCLVSVIRCHPGTPEHVWSETTLLLSPGADHPTTDQLDNDPLDNLSDLRDIHQFDLDLSNYTDHTAVETSETLLQEFKDHFNLPDGMDTRDYNDSQLFVSNSDLVTSNDLDNLNPDLYEVVTSSSEEANTYDENLLGNEHYDDEGEDGMDGKYFTLLENLHKKFHHNRTHDGDTKEDEDVEIHEEDNDVMHPLISLTAIVPNSMRLAITPKKYSENSMVRLMYKRVPRNKPAKMKHLDDPVIEYIHLYRVDQEHFLTNLPMGKYIVCADYSIEGVVVQHNCFETFVERPDTNELQGGVVGIIALAMLTLISCMGYAIYQRCIRMKETEVEEIITSKH